MQKEPTEARRLSLMRFPEGTPGKCTESFSGTLVKTDTDPEEHTADSSDNPPEIASPKQAFDRKSGG